MASSANNPSVSPQEKSMIAMIANISGRGFMLFHKLEPGNDKEGEQSASYTRLNKVGVQLYIFAES